MLIHTHTYMPNEGNKTIATVDDTPVSNAITQQKEEEEEEEEEGESLKGLRNELDNANKASDLLRANVKLLQEKLLTANTKEETSQVDYIFLFCQKVLKVIELLKSKIFPKKKKKKKK